MGGSYQQCQTALTVHCKVNTEDSHTYKVYPLLSLQLVDIVDHYLIPSIIMETADATFMEQLRWHRMRTMMLPGEDSAALVEEMLLIRQHYGDKYRQALDDAIRTL